VQEEQEFINQLLNPKTQNQAFQRLLEYQNLIQPSGTIVLNHDDTDDVLQNCFIKIFQHLKSFKGDSKLFFFLMYRITQMTLTFLKQKKPVLIISHLRLCK
jgi:RNA polymerase sigma-70 factor (ECF subfamily)